MTTQSDDRAMAILGFIIQYRATHGASPSFQEMAQAIGLDKGKSTAHRAVIWLNAPARRFVTRIEKKANSVRETPAGRDAWEEWDQKRSAGDAEREEGK
jgi:SOS-response transcriptional repressor LexA